MPDRTPEWIVKELTPDRAVLEPRSGEMEWLLPSDLLSDQAEEGDVLQVMARVVADDPRAGSWAWFPAAAERARVRSA